MTQLVLGVNVRPSRYLWAVLPSPTSRSRAAGAVDAVSDGTQGGRRRLAASAGVVRGPGPISSPDDERGSLSHGIPDISKEPTTDDGVASSSALTRP